MSVLQSVSPSVCLSVCESVCLSPSVCMSFSVSLSVSPSLHLWLHKIIVTMHDQICIITKGKFNRITLCARVYALMCVCVRLCVCVCVYARACVQVCVHAVVRVYAIIIMYIYHALIDTLNAHIIRISLNTVSILYTCRARSYSCNLHNVCV